RRAQPAGKPGRDSDRSDAGRLPLLVHPAGASRNVPEGAGRAVAGLQDGDRIEQGVGLRASGRIDGTCSPKPTVSLLAPVGFDLLPTIHPPFDLLLKSSFGRPVILALGK